MRRFIEFLFHRYKARSLRARADEMIDMGVRMLCDADLLIEQARKHERKLK